MRLGVRTLAGPSPVLTLAHPPPMADRGGLRPGGSQSGTLLPAYSQSTVPGPALIEVHPHGRTLNFLDSDTSGIDMPQP